MIPKLGKGRWILSSRPTCSRTARTTETLTEKTKGNGMGREERGDRRYGSQVWWYMSVMQQGVL